MLNKGIWMDYMELIKTKFNVILIVTTNKQIFGDGGRQFDI